MAAKYIHTFISMDLLIYVLPIKVASLRLSLLITSFISLKIQMAEEVDLDLAYRPSK